MKKLSPKKFVLLRVGIDRGCGGMAGPLFKDGSFEFIPIDAKYNKKGWTYGNTLGVKTKKPLIEYFPESRKKAMHDSPIHNDPEFKTFTYGDPTMPKQGLRHLEKGDLLVFYCGLKGWNGCTKPEALYLVGYFVVDVCGTYPNLVEQHSKDWVSKTFPANHHIIHNDIEGCVYERRSKSTGKVTKVKSELILVKGDKNSSRLFKKAVRLSAPRKRKDRRGHNIYVLDPELADYFGRFTALNAIQRSIPRWVDATHIGTAASFLLNNSEKHLSE